MKALTSDVIGQAEKKSPIKEQKQSIETLEKEEIHHHTSELIQKKMSTNERNCFIEVKNELKDFMDETDKAIKKARMLLEEMSNDEHERYIAGLREKYILDQLSIEQSGIEKGIEKGIEQRNKEIVKKLKEMNFSIDKIVEVTGLKKEEIEKM